MGGGENAVVHGGMAISDQGNRKAERQRTPGCGVDAEIALEAANDEVRNVALREEHEKVCIEVGVRGALANTNIRGRDVQVGGELPAGRVELKWWTGGFVLDEDDRNARDPAAAGDEVDAIDNARRLEGGIFAIAEGLLYVDDEKCGGHVG